MNVKEQKSTDLKKEYVVTLSAQDIEAQVDKRLNAIGASVTLPGFRKGKAPLAKLRQQYGQRAWGEAVETAIQEAADKVINDNKLRPAGQPHIHVEDGTLEPGKDVAFNLSVEVTPKVDIMDFSKISLTRRIVKGDQKSVDETLDNLRNSRRNFKDAPEGTKAKKGDTVVIDFEGEAEGVGKLPGMKGQGANLELGSNSFIPGFEDQLVGVKAGDHVHVNVTFPDQYHSAELAGKKAMFHVDVKAVQSSSLPELDDDFAQALGVSDLKDLKAHIERDVQSELDRLSRLSLKRDLLDILDENHVFEVPQSLVDAEYAEIEKQAENPSDEEKAELRAIAERRVRLGVVLTEAGEKHGVTVSPEELRAAAINEARKYPGQEAKIFEMFQKRPDILARLRAPIYEEKVVDLMIEKAKVKEEETTREALIKSLEEADTYKKPAAEKKAAKAKK